MKRITQNTLALTFCLGLFNSASAQSTQLYIGSKSTNELQVVDTTGGTYTVWDTRTMTSDAGTVNRCLGLSLQPSTGDMYILYRLNGVDESERNLGVLDTLTGAITDIGPIGSLANIAFVNDVLYATTGSYYSGYTFVEVNYTDPGLTDLFDHSSSEYGPAIGYNFFDGTMLKMDNAAYTSIDLEEMTESVISTTGHPGECHAIAMKNDSIALVFNYDELYEFNLNTNTFSYVMDFSSSMHAMAFGQIPLSIIVNGPTTFCSGDPSELTLSEEGDSYQWRLDGVDIAGATEASYIPEASGVYTCQIDDDETNGVSITVLPSPEASFTATPNPVSIGGTVAFENTTATGDEFFWDFDNGFNTITENPSLAFIEAGIYEVTLWVTDSETGCSDSAIVAVEVLDNVGLEDLNSGVISIFPIPSTDFVTINFNGVQGIYTGQLIDVNGKVITTKVLNASQENSAFDIRGLENGVYFIKIFDENAEKQFRIVKN